MPNHITNIIRFQGDPQAIARMFRAIACDDPSEHGVKADVHTIDFGKIIPQPDDLYQGDLGHAEREKYGTNNWCDWNNANWGTKWNSYGYSEYDQSENALKFNTAWSAPHPVIKRLSEMYPEIGIEHSWADEDIGYNCGKHTYMGGDRIEEYYPTYGKEAIDFACEIKGYSPKDLDLMLNATGTDYINAEYEEYQVIQVCGVTALFSNNRLTIRDIPAGTYVYDLRDSDDGKGFASLERHVAVNHGGSVVTKEPINFGNKDYIGFTDETSPNFTGEEATFGMFLRDEINLDQGMGGM